MFGLKNFRASIASVFLLRSSLFYSSRGALVEDHLEVFMLSKAESVANEDSVSISLSSSHASSITSSSLVLYF